MNANNQLFSKAASLLQGTSLSIDCIAKKIAWDGLRMPPLDYKTSHLQTP